MLHLLLVLCLMVYATNDLLHVIYSATVTLIYDKNVIFMIFLNLSCEGFLRSDNTFFDDTQSHCFFDQI